MRHPRMTRHLHLCVQAASERVLLAMRRQYTYAQYREIAARLREFDPRFNITTDIIIGFPGETDEDFSASVQSVTEVGFGHVHAFPYSRRQGTRADRMAVHIGESQKASRAAELAEASEAAKRRYRESLVGTIQEVLVEGVAPV